MSDATVRVAGREYNVVAVRSQPDLPPITDCAPVTVDIETNGTKAGLYDPEWQLRTVQLSSPAWGNTAYVIPNRIEFLQRIVDVLDAAPVLMAHNAMVEWQGLALADVTRSPADYWHKTIDTMLMVAVASHPEGPSGDARLGLKDNVRALVDPDYDLDTELKAWFKPQYDVTEGVFKSGPRKGLPREIKTKVREAYSWATCPTDAPQFLRYAAGDVIVPEPLFDKLSGTYSRAKEHYRVARDLSALMQKRTVRGLEVDEGALIAAEADLAHQVKEPVERLRAAGLDPTQGYTAENRDRLVQCLKDVGIPVPMTKGTENKGPQEALGQDGVRLAADGKPLPQLLQDWYTKEQAVKFKSAYLDLFRDGLEYGNGLIHPDIRIMQAATGRTSVAKPPLQQLPTEGTTRGCLRASAGKVLVSADLSQIEFRIAGALSGDQALLDMVLGGIKIHNVVAKLAFGEGFNDHQYGAAKTAVYAWLYGATPATIARQTGVSMATAKKLIQTIERMFPALVAFKRSRMSMRRATTWYGREILLNNDAPWAKLNYEVQGSAYDLFTIGTLAAAKEFGDDAIWLTVHDEVIVEVDEADGPEAARVLGKTLSTEFMGVPCPAVGKVIGRNWSK